MERLTYALIGLVFGLVLGALLWLGLHDLERRSLFWPGSFAGLEFTQWTGYVGASFAAVGFVFKERAGSLVGRVFAGWFDLERYVWSWWMPFLLAVFGLVWYFFA